MYRSLATVVTILAAYGVSAACNVPVFRYALERWEADPYELVIFHRGGLGKDHSKVAAALTSISFEDESKANIVVTQVDLDASADPEMLKLWKTHKNADQKTPHLVVRYPVQRGGGVVWSAPFSAAAAARVVNSPARQEIAKRILAGESAVWVLLESGDAEADQAVETILKTQFRKMENELTLPNEDDGDESSMTVEELAKLRIAFSLVRISAKDPAEQFFAEMLLGTELDLRKYKQPLVFPIYGRGRALFALVGKGINESNITEAGMFLTGACSCQIKAQNPGTDMLMAVDWDGRLGGSAIRETKLPDLIGLPAALPSADQRAAQSVETRPADAIPSGCDPSGPAPRSTIVRNVLLAALGVLVLMVAVRLVLKRSSGGS